MINLNNYESWFLQYADGECSPAEQQAVESFLLLHPALKEELDQILELRLLPHVLSMPDKELLRFQELDELNRQYRLEPDPGIIFPDKRTLYKKEGTRFVYFYRSLSAAAVLLFGIGLYWVLFTNDPIEKKITIADALPGAADKQIEAVVAAPHVDEILKPAEKVVTTTSAKDFVVAVSDDEIISQSELSVNKQDMVIAEVPLPIQEITKPVSNLSEEVLKAAASRMEPPPMADPIATPVNTTALINDAKKTNDKKSLRSLVRTLSRRIIHDENEDENAKYIQVASFHIHVKN